MHKHAHTGLTSKRRQQSLEWQSLKENQTEHEVKNDKETQQKGGFNKKLWIEACRRS